MANVTDLFNEMIASASGGIKSLGEMMNSDPQPAGLMTSKKRELQEWPSLTYGTDVEPVATTGPTESMEELNAGFIPDVIYSTLGAGDVPSGIVEYPEAGLRSPRGSESTLGGSDIPLSFDEPQGSAYLNTGDLGVTNADGSVTIPAPAKPLMGDVAHTGPTEIAQPPMQSSHLNIADRDQLAQAIDANVTRDARQMEQMAKDRGLDIMTNGGQAENKGLWKMVKDASDYVGDKLDIGFEEWGKLAPSTRLALIGSAATAYAYSRGWKKTAGDVALTSANMYTNMYGQEQAAEAAGVTAQGKIDAEDMRLRAKNAKPTYTEGDRENVSTQIENIVTQSGEFDSWIPFMSDPEKKAQYVASLTDEYLTFTGGVQENMVKVPILQYLKLKQQKEQATK